MLPPLTIGVTADVGIRVDDDHRRTIFNRFDRGGKSGGASADDDDIGFMVPVLGNQRA